MKTFTCNQFKLDTSGMARKLGCIRKSPETRTQQTGRHSSHAQAQTCKRHSLQSVFLESFVQCCPSLRPKRYSTIVHCSMASQALLTSLQQWACVLVLLTSIGAAAAQDCYYPNGDLSPNDSPCSSEVQGACCPLNWECLSNGLCYLESEDYYERHTCTDQSWSDSNCPNLCTYSRSSSGWFRSRNGG